MDLDWQTVSSGVFALGGVLIGGWLNSRADAHRWQRDWMTGRIQELRRVFADTIEAVDVQYKVLAQARDAAKGLRPGVPVDRVRAADEQWIRIFSRSKIELTGEVELAIVAFDEARAEVAETLNAGDSSAADLAVTKFEGARRAVLLEMNPVLNSMNESLAPHLFSWRQRAWAHIRREPLYVPNEGRELPTP
jgi:hypothetical protein